MTCLTTAFSRRAERARLMPNVSLYEAMSASIFE